MAITQRRPTSRGTLGGLVLTALAALFMALASPDVAQATVRFSDGAETTATIIECNPTMGRSQISVTALAGAHYWIDFYDSQSMRLLGSTKGWTYVQGYSYTPIYLHRTFGTGYFGLRYWVTTARWIGGRWQYRAEWAQPANTWFVLSDGIDCFGRAV